ncbi:MAG: hypothetical protein GX303_01870 [Clostridiales bacterium]|nr:hypothetical protein [Clostridiales bacterium]
MTKRKVHHYFAMLSELSKILLGSAALINSSLSKFNITEGGKVKATLNDMRQRGKFQRRNIRSRLYTDFITPLERDDILSLADDLCSAIDRLYEAYARICLFRISKIREEGVALSRLLNDVCFEICSLFTVLHDYKNKNRLLPHIDEIVRLSSEAGKVCEQASANLTAAAPPSLEAALWFQILDKFNEGFAACQIIAKKADLVILKNS